VSRQPSTLDPTGEPERVRPFAVLQDGDAAGCVLHDAGQAPLGGELVAAPRCRRGLLHGGWTAGLVEQGAVDDLMKVRERRRLDEELTAVRLQVAELPCRRRRQRVGAPRQQHQLGADARRHQEAGEREPDYYGSEAPTADHDCTRRR
jgi:hypothetical protein